MNFSITSANNGTLIPADGFCPSSNFTLDVLGGTTINAELHVKVPGTSTFVKMPADGGRANITDNYSQSIINNGKRIFKINVITATGTWNAAVEDASL